MEKKRIKPKKNKKKDKKRNFLMILESLVIVALVWISIIYSLSVPRFSGNVIKKVDQENFQQFLQQQSIIKELPKNAVISLKLYTVENGIKIFEDSYIIKKSSVVKGEAEKPDITINLNSKYIPELADFCTAAKKAVENKDLTYETKMNLASLLFKYGKMLKYKSCFGL